MKPILTLSLILTSSAALALGGSMYAFAAWQTPVQAVTAKLQVADMPPGLQPSVDRRGKNAIVTWTAQRIVPGVKMQGYVVTRLNVDDPSATPFTDTTTTAGYRDVRVPKGSWTWTVRPVFETWQGEDGPASQPLTFNGPAAAGLLADEIPMPSAGPESAAGSDTADSSGSDATGDTGPEPEADPATDSVLPEPDLSEPPAAEAENAPVDPAAGHADAAGPSAATT
jgi:hypothetical protein